MSASRSKRALTLAQAAERLERSTQRVSQLLRSGTLKGPNYGEGRAPNNVGRVYETSLTKYLTQATTGSGTARRRRTAPVKGADAAVVDELLRRVAQLEAAEASRADDRTAAEEAIARRRAVEGAALHLKVAADASLSALKAEELRTVALIAEVAALREQIAQANRTARETVLASYSDALTQVLGPDSLADFDSPTSDGQ